MRIAIVALGALALFGAELAAAATTQANAGDRRGRIAPRIADRVHPRAAPRAGKNWTAPIARSRTAMGRPTANNPSDAVTYGRDLRL